VNRYLISTDPATLGSAKDKPTIIIVAIAMASETVRTSLDAFWEY
jgi:hypothetical protein